MLHAAMAHRRRCQIESDQRKILLERFKEGMNAVNKSTEEMRSSVAKETGLALQSVNHWINNYKKRNPDSRGNGCEDISHVVKRRKMKKTSSYNLFSKDFNKTGEAQGKSLGERAAMMAVKWRSLSVEEKEEYEKRVQEVNDCPLEALSLKEKKDIMLRIAKRHQADANTAQQLGFQVASMYYLDGEIVTVGTTRGKAYLNSHPAILATFQADFLYEDFAAKSKAATASTSTKDTTTTPQVTMTTAQTTAISAKVTKPPGQVSTTSIQVNTTQAQETIVPTSSPTLLLKNNHNVVIATGKRLEGNEIHGHEVHPGCCKVIISEVLLSGSKTWFPSEFGEDILEKGAIVEWPLNHMTSGDSVSPLVTRAKRRR